jgi:hypothetical protein
MTKMFDNKYRYLNDDEKGMRCPSDCGCIGGCRIYSGIYPYPVKVALVTLYEITEDDGDKYFLADWSEELSEALEATGDQGEHTDKLFEMVEAIRADADEEADECEGMCGV